MTPSGLSAAISAAMITELGTPGDPAQLQKFCDALGMAIVTYIQTTATVTAMVTSGAGAPGTVTGTAPGAVE